ncbi:irregular chiasm C-roughest protein isoform X1 [Schistocerca gregaria]|uniref:irregular chiasm C-roughest protein isoform X1 n=1 Tax=Schistocerca gregaria TaxID=7010 RepID=UPI00211F23C6|nr:irregular chiasm C-roughest protein isoform X1 [Schistocerca gregaria]
MAPPRGGRSALLIAALLLASQETSITACRASKHYKQYRGGILEAGGLQRFEQQPEYTEVNAREDAILSCKIINKKGTCSWQKDNKPVGIYEKKYEWAGARDQGDCSLLVRAATLEFDDGEWECQVTPSDYTTQDALTSTPVRLVVRAAPQVPRIEYNSSQVLPGHNLSANDGDRVSVKCISRYGNPAANIKWFLGEEDVTSQSSLSTAKEADNPRTWVAHSVLQLRVARARHGSPLKCVALHGSYSSGSADTEVRLDVRYAPEVRLSGVPTGDVEEGVSHVELRCEADANPAARVVWRLAGEVASVDSRLRLAPAVRRNSGTYTCSAQNSVGTSRRLAVDIDVKYPPQILSVGPDRLVTAALFSPARFSCDAEGNPPPQLRWLQRVPAGPATGPAAAGAPAAVAEVLRGTAADLDIANVTYELQGEYVCQAVNTIGGSARTATSEPVSLQVVGAPQVLGGDEVVVSRGEDALLTLVVCGDPRPDRVSWEWGSQQLREGTSLGRYEADPLADDVREDCYEARLRVREVSPADQRQYYLTAENDRGKGRHALHLLVREPLSVTTLVSVAAGLLLLLLVVLFAIIFTARREKCCFARQGNFRPSDLESEKSDAESGGGGGGGGRKSVTNNSSDYNSATRPPPTITGGSSPDAMKRRFSGNYSRGTFRKEREKKDNLYADLQVPTISNNGSTMMVSKEKTTKFHNEPQPGTLYSSFKSGEPPITKNYFQPSIFERAEL